jgi:hypothetical protein
MKDLLKVAGFYENTKIPLLEFHTRNEFISMATTKIEGVIFKKSVTASFEKVFGEKKNTKLMNFICSPSDVIPLHLEIFLELKNFSSEDLEKLEKVLEDEIEIQLCERQQDYGDDRKFKTIEKLKIFFVKDGTFKEIKNQKIKSGLNYFY